MGSASWTRKKQRQPLVDRRTAGIAERQIGRLARTQVPPEQFFHKPAERLATNPHNPHRPPPGRSGNRDDGVLVAREHKKLLSEGEP